MNTDTIAAISTSIGSAGIGIVRISGDEALDIIEKIFVPKYKKNISKVKSHTIHYGHIIDKSKDNIVDEVLVMVMKGPNTFTKENIVEINCHGGVVVVQKVLQIVLECGARIAEPGEFTKRAFLNGRIDLSQAEAVIDIINAKTDLSLKASVNQLEGRLANKIKLLRKKILETVAHIEVNIDYPEYDMEQLTLDKIKEVTEETLIEVNKIIKSAETGRILKDGIKTVIIGKPNVGKSSLMNYLLNEQRAIVTDIPGTTRDTLEEFLNIGGVPLRIIDTAGIRETEDIVEKIGVEKSIDSIESADLVILLLDHSRPLDEQDRKIIKMVEDKKYIVLLNKMDLNPGLNRKEVNEILDRKYILDVSIKEDRGMDLLEDYIKDMFFGGKIDMNQEVYINSVRHKNALLRARNSLHQVLESIEMGMPMDCCTMDIQTCYEALGEVTGESLGESIIEQIFSQFCLGK